MAVCPTCNGWGKLGAGTCGTCGGSGSVPEGTGGGSTCFPGYVEISTPQGRQRIDQLSPGDKVQSVDKQGRLTFQPITRVKKHHPDSLIRVITAQGSLDMTRAHSMKTDRGWLRADKLQPGDRLCHVGSDGKISAEDVTGIEPLDNQEAVYNLVVNHNYTFMVNGYIAHSFTYFRTLRMLLDRMLRHWRKSSLYHLAAKPLPKSA